MFNSIMCRLYFLISFMAFALTTKSQQLNFFKPDNLKQLPSSETYNIMQDSRGYIWFSTEAGLCRYNGNNIKVFSTKEGLPEGATYCVLEDKTGKIWFVTSRNRILNYTYTKDSLFEASFSAECVKKCKEQLQQIYFAQLEGDSNLWLTTQSSTNKINIYSNSISPVSSDKNSAYYFLLKPGVLIPQKDLLEKFDYLNLIKGNMISITIITEKKQVVITIPYFKNYFPEGRVLTAANKKGEYFIAFDDYLIKLNPDLTWQVHYTDHPILNLYIDKDDGLWIAAFKGGLTCYPNSIINNSKITSLPDLTVTGVCEDAEKGIWCTTLEKGVFYCRNKYVINYSNIPGLDKKTDLLKSVNYKVLASSNKDELFEIDINSIKKHDISNKSTLGLTDIIRYKNLWIFSTRAFVGSLDTNFKNLKTVHSKPNNLVIGANQLAVTNSQRVFGAQRNTLLEIVDGFVYAKLNMLKSPNHCILYSHDGNLLLGCKNGAYITNLADSSLKQIEGISGAVVKMIEIKNAEIWMATKDNGIYILKNNLINKISDSLSLPTNRFSDITEDRYGTIWLASNVGLIKISKPYEKENVKVYNSLHGIFSDEVFKVAAGEDRIFASTYDGLCSFPLSYDLSNNVAPQLFVSKIKVNEKEIDFTGVLPVLKYDENNIKITFDILTFKSAGSPVKLFYTLDGLDDRKHFTEGRELELNNLPAGKYGLHVFAVNNDNKESALAVNFNFEIKKPFWKTLLFIIGAFLLLVAIVFFIVNKIISRIEKKEQEKTRVNKLLAEYQMSALRAQMNPHFIFNCINSIQRYVLTNKPEEAYNYLAKFSKLIRLVLNYAEENLISLAQEIEIVELYTLLEQLRFENKFTFSIEVSEDVDENEIMVPVMIMQPYIENAIWHGLMNLEKGKQGEIKIKINLESNLLKVVIEDNGVGLKQAALLSKKGHKSKGTDINNKRAEILHIMSNGEKGKVIIEEIINEHNKTEGTRVVIYIPQTNNLDYE
jgi:ligand-binding sensor domain-containing protein